MKWTKIPPFVKSEWDLYICNCWSKKTKKEQRLLDFAKKNYPNLVGTICGHSLLSSSYYDCVAQKVADEFFNLTKN